MNPDDRQALADLDAELAGPQNGRGRVARNPQGAVVWLRRLVGDLDARVTELEKGGIPEVIAQKDAEIAARDAQLADHAVRIRDLEAAKLPDPQKWFRDQDPFKVQTSEVIADDPGKVTDPKNVQPTSDLSAGTVANHEKTHQR